MSRASALRPSLTMATRWPPSSPRWGPRSVPGSKSPEIKAGSSPAVRRRRAPSPASWRPARAPTTPIFRRARSPVSRRFRGLRRAPKIAGRPSAHNPDNEPARAVVRRGAPPAEDHPQRIRRKADAEADVRRAHSRRRALARPALHRVRAAPARRRQKGTRRGISGRDHAAGEVVPAQLSSKAAP